MIVVALLVAILIGLLVAGRVFNSYHGEGCMRSPAVCAADVAESAPLLSHDDEPERHLEIVHDASSEVAAAATPTTGALPFFDDASMPPFRPRPSINRAALLAAMNQGDELPAGFQFVP